MAELKTFFFDTYAFYELIEGNPKYKYFEKGISIVTTRLNLMELHYGLLRLYGKETADKYYDDLIGCVIEIDDDTIKEANEFRLINKKRNLSYVDCIGYTLSKKFSAKFLTGDKEFKYMDNVEFVK